MIDAERFNRIKEVHGSYASWAVWAPSSGGATSNMGNLQVFDERTNPMLLETLHPGVLMVGLNLSRRDRNEPPFRNFHDSSGLAKDFKIRFAFQDTEFWGAYMTDVIKGIVQPSSGELRTYLRRNPEVVRDHVNHFRSELQDLGHSKPVILAFGRDAHDLVKDNLGIGDYSLLIRLTHYSHWISKESYRETVHRQIRDARNGTA